MPQKRLDLLFVSDQSCVGAGRWCLVEKDQWEMLPSLHSLDATPSNEAKTNGQEIIMWISDLHWSEFVLRGVVVYAFLLLLLRLTGKRQVGQMSPFDLVLLLVLSNAVQNSMNGGDNTITGGLILAAR